MREAAERLQAAFADVPRPPRVHGCPCCVEPGADLALLDRPLRDLGPDDLSRYAAQALNTWGDAGDFRYFAPRLLELAADDAFVWPDTEIIFTHLARARWWEWPERAAVAGFMGAFWTWTLARYPDGPSAGTTLCALGCAGDDLAPRLAEWATLPGAAAIRHLHEFVTTELVRRRGRPRLQNAFWDTSAAPYRQVVDWLTGGSAAAAVEAAFARTGCEELLGLLVETDRALTG